MPSSQGWIGHFTFSFLVLIIGYYGGYDLFDRAHIGGHTQVKMKISYIINRSRVQGFAIDTQTIMSGTQLRQCSGKR